MFSRAGHDLFYQQEIDKAEKCLLTAIKISPDCWEAHFQLCHLYYNRKELDKAIYYGEMALTYEQDEDVIIFLSLIYISVNLLEKAENLLLALTDKKTDNGQAIGLLSYIYILNGDKKKALLNANKSLLLSPGLPVAKNVLELLKN